MGFQDMNILFIVIFSVVILGGIAIFIVAIASIFSPKFQGKWWENKLRLPSIWLMRLKMISKI